MTTPTNLPVNPYSNRGRGEYVLIRNQAQATISPGAILNGASATGTVAVKGATLGDFVDVSYGATLQGCTISGYVNDGDSVTWVITNNTGGTITPAASTTISIVVYFYPQNPF